jgi:hypothetical protein
MLELIIICAVVVVLVAAADKARANKATPSAKPSQATASDTGNSAGSAGQTVAASTAEPSAAKPPRNLVIDGTDGFPLNQASFFAGFGVPTKKLVDARVYKRGGSLADFPTAVAQALQYLYEEGTAMGADAMRVVHHGRKLEANEALYFGLALTSTKPEDYTMFAFVDRAR